QRPLLSFLLAWFVFYWRLHFVAMSFGFVAADCAGPSRRHHGTALQHQHGAQEQAGSENTRWIAHINLLMGTGKKRLRFASASNDSICHGVMILALPKTACRTHRTNT